MVPGCVHLPERETLRFAISRKTRSYGNPVAIAIARVTQSPGKRGNPDTLAPPSLRTNGMRCIVIVWLSSYADMLLDLRIISYLNRKVKYDYRGRSFQLPRIRADYHILKRKSNVINGATECVAFGPFIRPLQCPKSAMKLNQIGPI